VILAGFKECTQFKRETANPNRMNIDLSHEALMI
jgi:hypothetical protein